LYKRLALKWPIMPCWVHAELANDWKRLVESQVGAHSSGYDSPTFRLYWQMIEHRKTCEVCRVLRALGGGRKGLRAVRPSNGNDRLDLL